MKNNFSTHSKAMHHILQVQPMIETNEQFVKFTRAFGLFAGYRDEDIELITKAAQLANKGYEYLYFKNPNTKQQSTPPCRYDVDDSTRKFCHPFVNSNKSDNKEVSAIIRGHHTPYNSDGIHRLANILGICDFCFALICQSKVQEQITLELMSQSGKLFDPNLVYKMTNFLNN